MAAPYVTAVRTALKGVCRYLRPPAAAQCRYLRPPAAAQCRPLHVSAVASRTEPQRSGRPPQGTDDRRAEEEEEEEGPEYIPRKKAKNPMMVIGYAWMIGLPTGIIGFLLAKREVDKNRLKQLKVRQRMSKSNEGDYEGSRYQHNAQDVKLDQ